MSSAHGPETVPPLSQGLERVRKLPKKSYVTDFPARLRGLSGAVFAATVATAVGLALTEPGPALVPLVLFATLELFSEHRGVRLPGGVVLSGGFMVNMAAIVVFAEQGSILGALLVGAISGFDLRDLNGRRWSWVLFNAGVIGLAAAAAAAVYVVTPVSTTRMPVAILAAIPPTVAFVAVNWALVASSYAIEGTRSWRVLIGDLGPAGLQQVPFGLLGLFIGRLYLSIGAPVVFLLVVPILAAREVFASYLELRAANEATVRVLIRALEAKDQYTAGHAERVARFALYVGEELRFMPGRLERLRFAALMHDIGKLVVPNSLLNKPGKLTSEEYARVRAHEHVSMRMLSRIDFLAPVAPSSSTQHFAASERGGAIEPHIVAVADAFDAMTSTRSYRRALPQEVAFAELRDKAGTQFHPACVEALVAAIERRGERYGDGFEDDAHQWRVAPPDAGVGSAGLGDLARPGEASVSA